MEESQQILLNSLANSGISIPPDVISIQDLTPPTLFSISAQSLLSIDHSLSFPTFLPDSMSDRFNICTDLSSALKTLGYIGDISFHKFMYPSEEDMYKLVRFLVGRLSECSEAGRSSAKKNSINNAILEKHKTGSLPIDSIASEVRKEDVTGELANVEKGESLMVNIEDSSNKGPLVNHISDLEHEVVSRQKDSSKVRINIDQLQSGEKVLAEEVTTKLSDLRNLKEEHKLSKSAVDMPCDDQHPAEFDVKQLNQQVDARRRNFMDLESHGDALTKALEDKRRNLEEALCSTKPETHAKLQKLKQIELETQSLLSETKKREDELYNLCVDVEKQPKLAPRKSYIQRINEITKNSRKQDIDIERILKETRELQLESNSIQERLHRTYAVVDETVFRCREGKKDPVGQQAYRLLVSIHESFEEMCEKILATDRTHREAAEFEAKLSAIASRSLNLDKLQADLDAIKKENEFLHHLHKT